MHQCIPLPAVAVAFVGGTGGSGVMSSGSLKKTMLLASSNWPSVPTAHWSVMAEGKRMDLCHRIHPTYIRSLLRARWTSLKHPSASNIRQSGRDVHTFHGYNPFSMDVEAASGKVECGKDNEAHWRRGQKLHKLINRRWPCRLSSTVQDGVSAGWLPCRVVGFDTTAFRPRRRQPSTRRTRYRLTALRMARGCWGAFVVENYPSCLTMMSARLGGTNLNNLDAYSTSKGW